MLLEGVKVGFALTGSFCTFQKIMTELERMVAEGADVYPILSETSATLDTRFGKAEDWKNKIKEITGKNPILTIPEAEPIGPKSFLDVLVIAPCTGNTIAKIANAITDTPVTMACKAHLRNNKPVVIAVSTNDGLGANGKNIGMLCNMKKIYLVPFGQDDPVKKTASLVAKMELIIPTVVEALQGKQIQPMIVSY